MSIPITRIATYALTGTSLTFTELANVSEISMKVTTGTVTILGNTPLNTGSESLESTAITLSEGDSLTLSPSQSGSSIGTLTIDASGGAMNLVVRY